MGLGWAIRYSVSRGQRAESNTVLSFGIDSGIATGDDIKRFAGLTAAGEIQPVNGGDGAAADAQFQSTDTASKK